jgi:hypothetical protein
MPRIAKVGVTSPILEVLSRTGVVVYRDNRSVTKCHLSRRSRNGYRVIRVVDIDARKTQWINHIQRASTYIGIETQLPTAKSNRVFTNKPTHRRTVVARAVVIQTGRIRFASGVLVRIGKRRIARRYVAIGVIAVLILDCTGGAGQRDRAVQRIAQEVRASGDIITRITLIDAKPHQDRIDGTAHCLLHRVVAVVKELRGRTTRDRLAYSAPQRMVAVAQLRRAVLTDRCQLIARIPRIGVYLLNFLNGPFNKISLSAAEN